MAGGLDIFVLCIKTNLSLSSQTESHSHDQFVCWRVYQRNIEYFHIRPCSLCSTVSDYSKHTMVYNLIIFTIGTVGGRNTDSQLTDNEKSQIKKNFFKLSKMNVKQLICLMYSR